jgi:hypothetical protein
MTEPHNTCHRALPAHPALGDTQHILIVDQADLPGQLAQWADSLQHLTGGKDFRRRFTAVPASS